MRPRAPTAGLTFIRVTLQPANIFNLSLTLESRGERDGGEKERGKKQSYLQNRGRIPNSRKRETR